MCFKPDVYFAKVDHKGTSQICPKCGTHTGNKELSERIDRCSSCGYETNRDQAAAEVIRLRGLEQISTVGFTGMETPCVDVLAGVETQAPSVEISKERNSESQIVRLTGTLHYNA